MKTQNQYRSHSVHFAIFCGWMVLLFSTGILTASDPEPKPGEQVECQFNYKVGDQERELKYNLFVPAGYDGKKTYPLMLFLHGAGERGDDLSQVRKWGPPKIVGKKKDFPFILVSPQCPRSTWWTSHLAGLKGLVDDVAGKLKVDRSRMYCTGLSMGGYGTWALCAKNPKLFAAAAPICGGGEPSTGDQLVNLPIWAFHGDADQVVPLKQSERMVKAIREAGGKKVKLTVYEGVGHNSWSQAYATKELYDWMLANQLKPSAEKK